MEACFGDGGALIQGLAIAKHCALPTALLEPYKEREKLCRWFKPGRQQVNCFVAVCNDVVVHQAIYQDIKPVSATRAAEVRGCKWRDGRRGVELGANLVPSGPRSWHVRACGRAGGWVCVEERGFSEGKGWGGTEVSPFAHHQTNNSLQRPRCVRLLLACSALASSVAPASPRPFSAAAGRREGKGGAKVVWAESESLSCNSCLIDFKCNVSARCLLPRSLIEKNASQIHD
jgi:hypothetical protein